jgi:hypothetical protein
MEKTTPLGIRVRDHGYTEPQTLKQLNKRLLKTNRYFDRLNIGKPVRDEFNDYFVEFSDRCLLSIDEAYHYIVNEVWKPCGGIFEHAADSLLPVHIDITLVDTPFWVPAVRTYAVGMMDPNAKGAITICVAAVTKAQPSSVAPDWLRRVDALAKWEIGNLLKWRSGIAGPELGSNSPCGKK